MHSSFSVSFSTTNIILLYALVAMQTPTQHGLFVLAALTYLLFSWMPTVMGLPGSSGLERSPNSVSQRFNDLLKRDGEPSRLRLKHLVAERSKPLAEHRSVLIAHAKPSSSAQSTVGSTTEGIVSTAAKEASWLSRHPTSRNAIAAGVLASSVAYAWVSIRHASHVKAIPESVSTFLSGTAKNRPDAEREANGADASMAGSKRSTYGSYFNKAPSISRREGLGTVPQLLLGGAAGITAAHWYTNGLVRQLTSTFTVPPRHPKQRSSATVEEDEEENNVVRRDFGNENEELLLRREVKPPARIGKTFYAVYGTLAATLGYAGYRAIRGSSKPPPGQSASPPPSKRSVDEGVHILGEESVILARRGVADQSWTTLDRLHAQSLLSPDHTKLLVHWKSGATTEFSLVKNFPYRKRGVDGDDDAARSTSLLVRRDPPGWVNVNSMLAYSTISPDHNTVVVHWKSGRTTSFTKNIGNFGRQGPSVGQQNSPPWRQGAPNGQQSYPYAQQTPPLRQQQNQPMQQQSQPQRPGGAFAQQAPPFTPTSKSPNDPINPSQPIELDAESVQRGKWAKPQPGFENELFPNAAPSLRINVTGAWSFLLRLLLGSFVSMMLIWPLISDVALATTNPLSTTSSVSDVGQARYSNSLNRAGITGLPHAAVDRGAATHPGWKHELGAPSEKYMQIFATQRDPSTRKSARKMLRETQEKREFLDDAQGSRSSLVKRGQVQISAMHPIAESTFNAATGTYEYPIPEHWSKPVSQGGAVSSHSGWPSTLPHPDEKYLRIIDTSRDATVRKTARKLLQSSPSVEKKLRRRDLEVTFVQGAQNVSRPINGAASAPKVSIKPTEDGILISETASFMNDHHPDQKMELITMMKRIQPPSPPVQNVLLLGSSIVLAGAGALAAKVAFDPPMSGKRESALHRRRDQGAEDRLERRNPSPPGGGGGLSGKAIAAVSAGIIGSAALATHFLRKDAQQKTTGYGEPTIPDKVWRRSLVRVEGE